MGFSNPEDGFFQCPYCMEEVRTGASLCPHCRSILDPVAYARASIGRVRQGRGWLLGVCAETARRTGINVGLVRAGFVGLLLFGPNAPMLYGFLWLFYKLTPVGEKA